MKKKKNVQLLNYLRDRDEKKSPFLGSVQTDSLACLFSTLELARIIVDNCYRIAVIRQHRARHQRIIVIVMSNFRPSKNSNLARAFRAILRSVIRNPHLRWCSRTMHVRWCCVRSIMQIHKSEIYNACKCATSRRMPR